MVELGVFLAMALLLSYVEALIPFAVGIPGIKIGLANLAVLLCMYTFSFRDAMGITVCKAVLSGFLFGNVFMILYSIAGAVLSCLVMGWLKRRNKLHLPIVSAMGGVTHNIGQLLVAFFVVQTYAVWYYVPFLLISGLVMGSLNGMVAAVLLPFLKKIVQNKECL